MLHFKPENGDCCVHRHITASTYRVDKLCKVKLYTEFKLWNLKYFQSVSLLWIFRCGQSHESKYWCESFHYIFFLIVQWVRISATFCLELILSALVIDAMLFCKWYFEVWGLHTSEC